MRSAGLGSRPHCVHGRTAPERLQGVGGVAVEDFVEVAVDVEDGLDADVPEARRGEHLQR